MEAEQLPAKVFTIKVSSPAFSKYFNEMQEDLEALASSSNDLLSRWYAKEQVPREAASLHVLFQIEVMDTLGVSAGSGG